MSNLTSICHSDHNPSHSLDEQGEFSTEHLNKQRQGGLDCFFSVDRGSASRVELLPRRYSPQVLSHK